MARFISLKEFVLQFVIMSFILCITLCTCIQAEPEITKTSSDGINFEVKIIGDNLRDANTAMETSWQVADWYIDNYDPHQIFGTLSQIEQRIDPIKQASVYERAAAGDPSAFLSILIDITTETTMDLIDVLNPSNAPQAIQDANRELAPCINPLNMDPLQGDLGCLTSPTHIMTAAKLYFFYEFHNQLLNAIKETRFNRYGDEYLIISANSQFWPIEWSYKLSSNQDRRDESDYKVKFTGEVKDVDPYDLSSLGLDGVDAGNIEVSIDRIIEGPDWLSDKIVVYRLSDLGAYIDFDIQVGDQVEVYGIYPSTQRISGPYLVKLANSQHYLKKYNDASRQSALSLKDHSMAKDISNSDPVSRTTSFSTLDKKALSWLRFYPDGKDHYIEWKWFSPNGDLVASRFGDSDLSENNKNPICWDWVDISGLNAQQFQGDWWVNIYVDNKFYLKETFRIEKTEKTKVNQKKQSKPKSNDPSEFYDIGIDLMHEEKFNEAINYFDKVISLDPGDMHAYYYKMFCLSKLGRYEDALSCCEHAVDIEPNSDLANQCMGEALAHLGRDDESDRYFRKCKTQML